MLEKVPERASISPMVKVLVAAGVEEDEQALKRKDKVRIIMRGTNSFFIFQNSYFDIFEV